MLRLAVFASGRGSNLEAIYNSIESGSLRNIELALVVSNNSNSGALEFAKRKNINGIHLSVLKCNNDLHEFERRLLEALNNTRIDLIALAGYMKKLPGAVLEKYRGRIVNVHPALLPEFGGSGMYGLNVHRAVLEAGRNISGASVHLVEGEYDSGKIILQESCPVEPGDTPEILAERITKIEHRILPQAIGIIAESILHTK
ncbi:MAG: phosphoribosylglycinamide formyltransferase [Bacteroidota bacterium]|nr:phosphoribosylglycinamide formyltransferase [Bacteroidota bacterium]MDP4230360.1 phosphoribosylglycinamide formyltransferase [Bacteroidota bacterium]MDP4237805.1 phosphoribosylglycinamide formyltransferase [Bacteroidota bacterium]